MLRWTPRRPSPELRARIFGSPAPVTVAARALADFSRWLVPAFGCFLLVVGGLSQRGPGHLAAAQETNWLGTEWNRVDLSVQLALRNNASPISALGHAADLSTGRAAFAQPPAISHTNQLIQH